MTYTPSPTKSTSAVKTVLWLQSHGRNGWC